jgi:hypothetical protein
MHMQIKWIYHDFLLNIYAAVFMYPIIPKKVSGFNHRDHFFLPADSIFEQNMKKQFGDSAMDNNLYLSWKMVYD